MAENSEKITKNTSIRGLIDENTGFTSYRNTLSKDIQTLEKNVDVNTLYQLVKASPEVMSALQAKITDIMSDGWKFRGTAKGIGEAENFSSDTRFYKQLANGLMDLFLTGNMYILKLSISEDKINSLLHSISQNLAIKSGYKIEDKDKEIQLLKQELSKPKDIQVLKSGTVEISCDETGRVAYYKQQVGSNVRIYQPEDMIHISLMNIGNSVYGWSPVETLLSDIGTLIYAKEFAGKYFENDGMPHLIINLPEASGEDDKNYKLLKQNLTELKKKENKFRGLITTGNVNLQLLDKMDKDMQFRELITHMTQLVLIGLRVPASKVNWTVDIRQSAEATNDSKEEYYKDIQFIQKMLEDELNYHLWYKYFKVEMIFNRGYQIDELREANIVATLIDRGAITLEEARERMGMEPEIPKGTIGKPALTPATTQGDGSQEAQGKQRVNSHDDFEESEGIDNKIKSRKRK